MSPSPEEMVRRFEWEVSRWAPLNRRTRELYILCALNSLETALAHRIGAVVKACRGQGASWQDIGEALHVSKQAAHQRFTHQDRSLSGWRPTDE